MAFESKRITRCLKCFKRGTLYIKDGRDYYCKVCGDIDYHWMQRRMIYNLVKVKRDRSIKSYLRNL